MKPEQIIDIMRDAMMTSLLVMGAPMGITLVVGLLVSVFQSVTQITEITLTFVPKIIAVFLSLLVFGPYMLDLLIKYTITIFTNIPQYAL